MGPKLQFAFLGPHNSYLASVTSIAAQSGRPNESVKVFYHGLPKHCVDRYLELTKNLYTSNIRGNDVFAFIGHVNRGKTNVYIERSENMIVEIEALRALVESTRTRTNEPLLLSLGPAPGSFFAEMSSLKRYRWTNLPLDLEDEIQQELCRSGYGTIFDVAINAAGGWVMQLNEGKTYKWGGKLPKELKSALETRREQRVQIKVCSLNHQNKDDYVLIFMNGSAHISLHEDFRQDMKNLVDSAFASNLPSRLSRTIRVDFNFKPCNCTSQNQDSANAAYYHKRGLFHLRRRSPVQALAYIREAYRLDIKNSKYREDYFMARVEAEARERIPEEHLNCDEAIQNESDFRKNRTRRVEELQQRLQNYLREAQLLNLPDEWAFVEDPPPPVGIVDPKELHDERGPYELGNTEFRELPSPREAVKQAIIVYR